MSSGHPLGARLASLRETGATKVPIGHHLLYPHPVLPGQPWKWDAILRLVFGVFICMYAGAVAGALMRYAPRSTNSSPLLIVVGVAALICLGISLFLLHKPWQLETAIRHMAFTLGFFYAGMILGALAHKFAGPAPRVGGAQLGLAALSFHGAALLLTTRFLRDHGLGWADGFGLKERTRNAVLAGIFFGCMFMPVSYALQGGSSWVLELLRDYGFEAVEQEAVQVLRASSSLAEHMKLALVTVVLAPVAEEVMFRGILFRWILQIGHPRLALWGTSVLFAMAHFNLVTFVPLLALALILAKLYERTDNLLAPIAAHSLFNLLNFTLLLIAKSIHP